MRQVRLAIIILSFFTFFIESCTPDCPPEHTVAVDAGLAQTLALSAASVDLNGVVTSGSTPGMTYSWLALSGPNNPQISNNTKDTTSVTGLVEGTYLFQFLATNSYGYTGIDTISITVIPAQITTVAFQPANNPNERFFALVNGNDGSGVSNELCAVAWTVFGNPATERSAVKFDMSGIPANATIVSARLSLFSNPTPTSGNTTQANFGTENSVTIRRIDQNWTAAGTTWFTQPTTTTTHEIVIPQSDDLFLDLVDIDVKDLVTDMQASGNFGFLIQLQNEVIYNCRIFCSSMYPDAGKHPKLEVSYY